MTGAHSWIEAIGLGGIASGVFVLSKLIYYRRQLRPYLPNRRDAERLGLVGLAVLSSAVLAAASFATTLQGIIGVAPHGLLAFLAAFGIQGTLYITSWSVAEESASFAHRRRWQKELEAAELGEGSSPPFRVRDIFSFIVEHPFSVLVLLMCIFVSV